MPNHPSTFWEFFKNKDFKNAQAQFEHLNEHDKQIIFQELFQKSECHRTPIMVSVLRRELNDDKSFDDFYKSWFPEEKNCNKVELGGQTYQQHFPIPVRVINATNMANPQEIISVGISWVTNAEEEKALWAHIENANKGKDQNNESRHEKIKEVAEGELLGIFKVRTDDNLGVPF
jgi:hypothetical protein